ncbi:replication endonuclease [Salmonella enterica]|uniref:replication endonuclease n=1 Tax=Salmonella enterica TaxID=28901 RepID=UPI0010796BA3|nr:replication endonuclease [Salmonella enterica]EAU5124518.1 replication endonuclease [Salmonella enterica subsp. enterica serovar Infantis]EDW1158291.1 replication endonuclease [Salmonella enterica subsp. enterica serovar Sundsvall]EED2839237.1 replication endonuclease [Salmonella enterica subsp. enterica serovar Oranienburg]EEJ1918586.1 replication endonuclease [Salmonella enterica subsp. enterica serovar Urbana]EGR7196786.1 replication endonuclease [Salmonella enterica subsp. enterica sero
MTTSHGRYAPTPPPPFPGKAPDTTVYPYPWNKPREAIGLERASMEDIAAAARERQAREQLESTMQQETGALPLFMRLRIQARMDEHDQQKGIYIAALKWRDFARRELPLLTAVNDRYRIHLDRPMPSVWSWMNASGATARHFADLQGLSERYNRLPEYTDEDVELLSQDIAIFIRAEMSEADEAAKDLDDYAYGRQLFAAGLRVAEHLNLPPAGAEKFRRHKLKDADLTAGVLQMQDDRYWCRRLKRLAHRWREHLQIAFGDVGRAASVYCSKKQISEWETQRKRTREILKQLEFEDEDSGERISVAAVYDSSVSNPALRRVELMTRIGGFNRIAIAAGFECRFYTMTAPSKYHARLHYGPRNHKWDHSTPKDTQQYLATLWQQIRADLARDEIQVFGLRVAEPHHDGTPHWHMLLFVRPEQADALTETLRAYAIREDRNELNTREGIKPRFDVENIDGDKGGAVAYIAKYISKNIDGYAMEGEVDDESGKPCLMTAKHATAWASLWGIRQFQFVGGAPVSVWRELRRMRDKALAAKFGTTFAELHNAADDGDWETYVMLQGGPLVSRRDLALRPWYEEQKQAGRYGTFNQIMKGIYLQHEPGLAPIITHIKKWKMVKKQPTPDTASELIGCSSFDLTVASATARTRVNNCTLNKKQPINDEKIATNITPVQQTIDQQIISTLGAEYQPGEYSGADGPDADIFRTSWVIPPHPYRQKNIAGGESTQVRIIKELRTRGIDDEDEIAHLLRGRMIGYGANSYLQVRNGNVTVVKRQQWCGHRECHNPLNEEDLRYGDEARCLAHSDPERVAERREQQYSSILSRVNKLRGQR